MAIGLSDILAALQNGVTSINNLNTSLGKVFPQTTALSTTAPAAGTITFTSSEALAFLLVTTSSGGIYKLAAYPST